MRNGERFRKKKKITARKPNTDGMGNCLQQPGQLINWTVKSMRGTLLPLIKIYVP